MIHTLQYKYFVVCRQDPSKKKKEKGVSFGQPALCLRPTCNIFFPSLLSCNRKNLLLCSLQSPTSSPIAPCRRRLLFFILLPAASAASSPAVYGGAGWLSPPAMCRPCTLSSSTRSAPTRLRAARRRQLSRSVRPARVSAPASW